MTQKQQIEQQNKEIENYKDILNILIQCLTISGDNILKDILNKNFEDLDRMKNLLSEYATNLEINVREELIDYYMTPNVEDDEEGNKKKPEYIFNFLQIGNLILDKNIGRIEKKKEYSYKKNEMEYFVRIIKKYPTPEEVFFDIPAKDEKEQEFLFNILKGKLKIVNLNTL